MIIEEYVAKDTAGKNRLFVKIECQVCKSIFNRQKRQMRNDYHCCSSFCLNFAKGLYIELKCSHCNIDFVRLKSRLENSKSGKYFCGRECKDLAQKYMIEIQPEHYGSGTGISSYRDRALNYYPNLCNRCGFTNILALEVHHIDRDRNNNDLMNLEILCANCHSIEHK